MGCSVSVSSWSLSKSVRSSSRSSDSSSSSSPSAAERAYREDVADDTRAFVKSQSGDFAGFQADLARLAEEHGITTGRRTRRRMRRSVLLHLAGVPRDDPRGERPLE